MAIKVIYKDKKEIPAGAESFYVEKGGEWHLEAEGMASPEEVTRVNGLLGTERTANQELRNSLKAFGDIKPDKVATLIELEALVGEDFDPKAFDSMKGELETLRSSRGADVAVLHDEITQLKRDKNQALKETKTIKAKFEEADTEKQRLQTEINRSIIRTTVQTAAEKAKILPEAIADVLLYGDTLFELDANGKVVARDNLPDLLTGATPEDWIVGCQPNKPHWWPRSTSAGGTGGDGKGTPGKNPWKAENLNLSEQGRIFTENPELARSMAKEAGVTL